jgi:hypothetical protein
MLVRADSRGEGQERYTSQVTHAHIFPRREKHGKTRIGMVRIRTGVDGRNAGELRWSFARPAPCIERGA